MSSVDEVAQNASAKSETCWPSGHLIFPAGGKEAVLKQSSDFLIAAENVPLHPYWPSGDSGITIGVGWDLGQHSRTDLLNVWRALGPISLAKLAEASNKKGHAAALLLPDLKSIDVPRDLSLAVFRKSLEDDYYPTTRKLFPGVEKLPAEAQVALISVVFNRGAVLGHDPDWKTATELDRRWEIRRLRDDVQRSDIFAIYIHLGTMKRLWEKSGPRGLLYRRRDEQHIIRPYVDKELRWEENRDGLKATGAPACLERPSSNWMIHLPRPRNAIVMP
jgi:hypothetical protein